MPTKIEITCDGCGADLTYTGNCQDYYLLGTYRSKSPWYMEEGLRGGFVTSMAVHPPIDRDLCFCDLKCLDHWRSRCRHFESLREQWWETWKQDKGWHDQTGRVTSYPCPDEETSRARKAEFEAAALAAFPMARP